MAAADALHLPRACEPLEHLLVPVGRPRVASARGRATATTPRPTREPDVSALAPTLQAFFTDYLLRQRQASPHTIITFRVRQAAAPVRRPSARADTRTSSTSPISTRRCSLRSSNTSSTSVTTPSGPATPGWQRCSLALPLRRSAPSRARCPDRSRARDPTQARGQADDVPHRGRARRAARRPGQVHFDEQAATPP